MGLKIFGPKMKIWVLVFHLFTSNVPMSMINIICSLSSDKESENIENIDFMHDLFGY